MRKINYIHICFSLLSLCLFPKSSTAAEIAPIGTEVIDSMPTRKIYLPKFIKKKEFIVGLTASFGSVSSENSNILYALADIDASLSHSSVDPFVGYFYRDNKCIGLRFGYDKISGSVDSGVLDFGESNDLEFEIPYVEINSTSFSYSVFHRNYLALDPKGSFGLFAELELTASDNRSTMAFDLGSDGLQTIHSNNFSFNLNFNPGIVVFVLDNISTNVSLGLGGLGYTSITQYDGEGTVTGGRTSSQLSFKLNILDINFGVTVHL